MTENPRITASRSRDTTREAPGATLRQTRRDQQVDRNHVRQQLGLTESLFDALENDDYDRLPAPVFVKGYLRRYAEVLGLRPAPILAAYQRHQESLQPTEETDAAVSPGKPERPVGTMVISALSLLLATSLVFGAMLSDGSGADGHTDSPAPSAASAPARGEQAVPARNRLALEFVNDSWVEVVDARDHILAVSLQRAGSRLDLRGKPPFEVEVGYGPGVEITYLGEQVDLKSDESNPAVETVIGP